MTKRVGTPGLWFARQEHHLRPITAEALWSPPLANSSPKKRDNRKDATARDSKAVIISNSQVSDFVTIIASKRRQRRGSSPHRTSKSLTATDTSADSHASPMNGSNESPVHSRSPSTGSVGSEAGQHSATLDVEHCDSHEITCLSPKSKTTLLRTPEAIEAMLYNSGRLLSQTPTNAPTSSILSNSSRSSNDPQLSKQQDSLMQWQKHKQEGLHRKRQEVVKRFDIDRQRQQEKKEGRLSPLSSLELLAADVSNMVAAAHLPGAPAITPPPAARSLRPAHAGSQAVASPTTPVAIIGPIDGLQEALEPSDTPLIHTFEKGAAWTDTFCQLMEEYSPGREYAKRRGLSHTMREMMMAPDNGVPRHDSYSPPPHPEMRDIMMDDYMRKCSLYSSNTSTSSVLREEKYEPDEGGRMVLKRLKWQTAEQAEEMRDRERHAHKDKRDRHRDSAHVRARRTGSASSTSDTAGNDAGGESSEGVWAGGRWQMLPRYDTGQGGQKGGVGGGRGFVAKELEYGFREMSLPPPATSSSSLLAHFVSPRAPPRPTGDHAVLSEVNGVIVSGRAVPAAAANGSTRHMMPSGSVTERAGYAHRNAYAAFPETYSRGMSLPPGAVARAGQGHAAQVAYSPLSAREGGRSARDTPSALKHSNSKGMLEQSKSTLAEVRQHLVRSSAALNYVYDSRGYTFTPHDLQGGRQGKTGAEEHSEPSATTQVNSVAHDDSVSLLSVNSEKDKETREQLIADLLAELKLVKGKLARAEHENDHLRATSSRAEHTVQTCLNKIARLEESNRDMAFKLSKAGSSQHLDIANHLQDLDKNLTIVL